MEEAEFPMVSVIIPVFNDGERLQHCLAALAQQTYPRSRTEIIVVDNNSAPLEPIKTAVELYQDVVLTFEATPGSYAARNQGIAVAQGTVIAFTDADCIPAPDWLAQGVQHLQNTPDCGQVIGKVELFFADPQRPTPVELYEQITAFPQERLLRLCHGGATANVFTWRSVIETVGRFDPQLKSNGDLEWGQRVYAHGYRQLYGESVVVKHPARHSLHELQQRTRRLAGGNYDLQLKRTRSPWQRHIVFVRTLAQHLMPPVFFTVSTFLDDRLQRIDQKIKVSSIMVFVRGVSAWEILRLKLGGASSRA